MKVVKYNAQTKETEIIEVPELESPPQEPTEIEVLKQQTADLNLRDIELFEILIEAGLI